MIDKHPIIFMCTGFIMFFLLLFGLIYIGLPYSIFEQRYTDDITIKSVDYTGKIFIVVSDNDFEYVTQSSRVYDIAERGIGSRARIKYVFDYNGDCYIIDIEHLSDRQRCNKFNCNSTLITGV